MHRFLAGLGAAALLSLSIGSASAASVINGWVPFEGSFGTCSGDLISVTGMQHYVFRLTEDGAIFGYHADIHADGVAADGTRYVANSTYNNVSERPPGPGAHESNYTFSLQLIAAGNGPIVMVKIIMHVTITPDGTVVVSRYDGRGCS